MLEASLDARVERILKEYGGLTDNREALTTATLALQKKLGVEKCALLAVRISSGDYSFVARTLCTDYYDLYYRDSRRGKGEYLAVINLDDLHSGALEVLAHCQKGLSCKKEKLKRGGDMMPEKVKLKIGGLSCSHCKMKIEKALKTLAGVQNVQVNLEAGEAEVDFDSAKTSRDELKTAISAAGYEVS